MIKKLRQYVLSDSGCENVDDLIKQNEQLKQKIDNLSKKLQKVELPNNKNSNLSSNKIEIILSILNKPQNQLLEQKRALTEQSKHINNLIAYIEKYLQQQSSQPRALQQKIKVLNQLISQAQTSNCPKPQYEKMIIWNTKLIQNLQKKLCELVSAFSTHFRIRLQQISCYKDLLNQQICREFVRALYKTLLVYDVPTFSYQLLMLGEKAEQKGIVTVQRESLIFTCDKAQANYTNIEKAITDTQKLALQICSAFGKDDQKYSFIIKNEIKNCQEDVKAIVQYILPYLKLEKRKNLIELLSTKSQSETTLYDILVRLRIKGQDGEMMESNVHQAVQKIKNDPSLVSQIQVFLQICSSQQKSLNMGFYVCNQFVNRLQNFIPYGEIQKLLSLREQMRFKIHHPI